jgi:hypothetical protein
MVVEFSPQIGIQSSSTSHKNKNTNNNHNHPSQTIWSGNAKPMKTPTQGNHKKTQKTCSQILAQKYRFVFNNMVFRHEIRVLCCCLHKQTRTN